MAEQTGYNFEFYFYRLRQDSEVLLSRASQWSQDLQSSTNNISSVSENNSSESTSSTETLKWLGSMSDISVASHATNSSAISGSGKVFFLFIFFLLLNSPTKQEELHLSYNSSVGVEANLEFDINIKKNIIFIFFFVVVEVRLGE